MAQYDDYFKISSVTLADQVFSALKRLILDGKWNVGDKLPSDNELASMFGVNRLTIRVALQKLAALGLTETKKGDGTYLVQFDISILLNDLYDFYIKPDMFDDICHYRLNMELDCARLAMERRTDEQIEHLYTLLDNMRSITFLPEKYDTIIDELVNADMAFHEYIIHMAGSSLYELAYAATKPLIYRYMCVNVKNRIAFKVKNKQLESSRQLGSADDLHYIIWKSLKDRDYPACASALSDMIDYHKDI